MKNRTFYLLFFLVFGTQITMAQNITKKSITGTWELDWVYGGFFPYEDLIFKKSDASGGQYIFSFENNGTLTQKLSGDELGECPVGAFIVEKGSWSLEEGFITISLKGYKIADYKFDYEIVYVPKLEGENLNLKVVEVSKSKQDK